MAEDYNNIAIPEGFQALATATSAGSLMHITKHPDVSLREHDPRNASTLCGRVGRFSVLIDDRLPLCPLCRDRLPKAVISRSRKLLKVGISMEEAESEAWVSIPEYEGIYEASNMGRVRRIYASSREPILLSPSSNKHGYLMVTLTRAGKERTMKVHRLVALSFLGQPGHGLVVNHKDGVKSNNKPSNLEYVTYAENSAHAHRMGLVKLARGADHGSVKKRDRFLLGWIKTRKVNDDQVALIRQLAKDRVPQTQIALQFGVTKSFICGVVSGRFRSAPLTKDSYSPAGIDGRKS